MERKHGIERFLDITKTLLPLDFGQGHKRATTKGKLIALSLIRQGNGATALDVGCREGIQSEWLKAKGYKVTSIDVEKQYRYCQIVDVNRQLPFPDNSFDMIWCSEVIEHLDDPKFSASEFNRVLRPHGEMVFTTPNSYCWIFRVLSWIGFPAQRVQRKDHKHFFHIQNIKEMFPGTDLYGFFPYFPPKFAIKRFLNFLSPTFVIHVRGKFKQDIFKMVASGKEYEQKLEQSFASKQAHKFYMQRKADILLAFTGTSKNKMLLDIGSGTGEMEELIASWFKGVVGIDSSQPLLTYARSKRIRNCTFVPLDGMDKLKPASFDFALMVNVVHHVTLDYERHKIFAAVHRYLKKGGTLIIFEHNPWNPYVWLRFNYISEIDRDGWMISSRKLKRKLKQQGFNLTRTTYLQFYPEQLKFLSSTEKLLGWLPVGGEYMVVAEK